MFSEKKKIGVLLKNMKNEVTARGRKKIIFFTVNLAVAFRFNMINKGLRISKIYDLLGQGVITTYQTLVSENVTIKS